METRTLNVFAPTKPHENQREVLKALKTNRFVLLRAGRKWRKTSLGISWLFRKAFETGKTCAYIAPNRVQAKNIAWNDHISRLLDEFKRVGLEYKKNEVELSITLPNGGKVQLYGVENAESLRGLAWAAVFCDEYDSWDQDIWPTIIRPNLMVLQSPALIAGTPQGMGNMFNLEQDPNFKSFHFRSHDNPELSTQELDAIEKEYEGNKGKYRQEILAEYVKPEGTVYEGWDIDSRYVPFEYSPQLPLHLSWDFGINDPTVILFFQTYGSELRLVDYYEASDANLEHFVSYINSKPYKKPELETGDIAGNQRQLTTGKSPIEVLSGMGHHVRTSHIPTIPDQVRQAHKFIPRLHVSKSNPNTARFVECLLNYRYPQKETTNEIPLHDQYSHAMRAFEYYCWNTVETTREDEGAYNRYREKVKLVRDRTLGF